MRKVELSLQERRRGRKTPSLMLKKAGMIYNKKRTKHNIMMNDFKDITVAVAGTGYVGLNIATLLSQHHHVPSVDVIPN